jgi:ribonuclease HI
MKQVIIYSDGACSPNPGTGGWAAILISPSDGGYRSELYGGEANTTNNRMELTAAIKGLAALRYACSVILHTDSQYLEQAFSAGWLGKWRENGWRTADRKDVANKDLWIKLAELVERHEVDWIWVRGHSDNPENNRADELAVAARQRVAREGRPFEGRPVT